MVLAGDPLDLEGPHRGADQKRGTRVAAEEPLAEGADRALEGRVVAAWRGAHVGEQPQAWPFGVADQRHGLHELGACVLGAGEWRCAASEPDQPAFVVECDGDVF